MARSGPPPNPNSRRQSGNQASTWVDLPSEGRKGKAPKWPLESLEGVDASRERTLWAQAWRSPQAVVWERLSWSHDVALYVRLMALAEAGNLKAAAEARQWSDRLGLNPPAMLRNRWRIVTPDIQPQKRSTSSQARRRLKVVSGDE